MENRIKEIYRTWEADPKNSMERVEEEKEELYRIPR